MIALALVLALAAVAHVGAQDRVQPLFVETFDSAWGVTPPPGWLNLDLLKAFYYAAETDDLWHFDNPGGQELIFPLVAPAAIFDSDTVSSSNNMPENVALITRPFDTRGVDFHSSAVVLDWDQHFVEGYDARIFVEVWAGEQWHEVYSTGRSTPNPDRQAVDLSPFVSGAKGEGIKAGRVRFRWTGDASWFWIIDNIRVSTVDLSLTHNGCPYVLPFKCSTDGSCVKDQSSCLLENHCPRQSPRRCLDGLCVAESKDCSDLIDCPAHMPLRCADGSCVENEYECVTADNCPIVKPVRCYDGTCAAHIDECPVHITCSDAHKPYPCLGGTCAAKPDQCPPINPVRLVCPIHRFQCPDLSCAADSVECHCPSDYPYLCTESRECVDDAVQCKFSTKASNTHTLERFGGKGAYRLRYVDACPAGQFKCFDGTCAASLSMCPHILCSTVSSVEGESLPYKCPDGSCARNRLDCAPIPACPTGWQRCADGRCAGPGEQCEQAPVCSYGRKRCPDGRCYAECPMFDGCPVDHPIQCPAGQCVERAIQCSQGCAEGEMMCAAGSQCRPLSDGCPPAPSTHRPAPFVGNLNGISRQQTSVYHDVVYIADKNYDELFGTITVPAGIFSQQRPDASIIVLDVPYSEVRPLPPPSETISPVLALHLPDTVFDEGDFVRLTLVVRPAPNTTESDYCLAALVEVQGGAYEWECQDNDLVRDGPHFSGLVNHTAGLFIVMRKQSVCHRYRGFDDSLLEFIMLGRVIPAAIERLQQTYNKLVYIRDRMQDIKRSSLALQHIAQESFAFTEQCLSTDWERQLASFPAQLGYRAPPPPAPKPVLAEPEPEPCCSTCSK